MRRAFLLLLMAALLSTAGATAWPAREAAAVPAAKCSTEGGHDDHGSDMDDMDMDHDASSKSCAGGTIKGARVIRVTGDRFRFTPKQITMASGEDVTIRLRSGDIAHDLYVKGVGHVVHAKADDSARGGLRIDEPGTYKFWCTVAGHKKAG